MRRDARKRLFLIVTAVTIGWTGWTGHPLAFAIAILLPALWAASPNRWTVTGMSGGYFLAASRGLPIGAANFYETDMWLGLLLWFGAAVGFVVVHAVLWTAANGWQRPVRYLVVMLLMALPPFGIVGWAHPATAAGALFPGWGWAGLAATVALLLAMTTHWAWVGGAVAAAAFVMSSATYVTPPSPAGWRGLDTSVGGGAVTAAFLDPQKQRQVAAQIRQTVEGGAGVVVLPESAAGIWTPTTARLWREVAGEATLLTGAARLKSDGYDNVMISVTSVGDQIVYRQRMPIPVSMWRPWSRWIGPPTGASASFVKNPVVNVAGRRIAILICYEQLLIWPVLQSFLYEPDVLVGTGNGWWTGKTSIIDIQKSTVEAWARLFGVPLVTAFNR